jgi:hypothetical protein
MGINKNTTFIEGCQASSDVVKIEVYADMLKVKQELQSKQQGGGVRKECEGFSDGSRRRLMQKMAQWRLTGLNLYFVTMTYPGVYAQDWHIWKRDLDTLIKSITRKYDCAVGCLWRIEFQKRGAPHFHMILATSKVCKNIALLRREFAITWADIVKDGYMMDGGKWEEYEQHYKNNLKAGTNVEEVKGRKQLMSYVSKYVAKNTGINAPDKFGRNWGFRDINGKLDFEPYDTMEVSNMDANRLKRLIVQWLRKRGQVAYAEKLLHMGCYSVFGLGMDSMSDGTISKMLGSMIERMGLLAPHISPGLSTGRFIDRVTRGEYGVKWAVVPGLRVHTPYGDGTVIYVQYMDVIGKDMARVEMDNWYKGVKMHTFYPIDCKAIESVEYKQLMLV